MCEEIINYGLFWFAVVLMELLFVNWKRYNFRNMFSCEYKCFVIDIRRQGKTRGPTMLCFHCCLYEWFFWMDLNYIASIIFYDGGHDIKPTLRARLQMPWEYVSALLFQLFHGPIWSGSVAEEFRFSLYRFSLLSLGIPLFHILFSWLIVSVLRSEI